MSRSRLTQVLNLLNLAPDIQEQILFLTWETAERRGIHERSVRQLSSHLLWSEQQAFMCARKKRLSLIEEKQAHKRCSQSNQSYSKQDWYTWHIPINATLHALYFFLHPRSEEDEPGR